MALFEELSSLAPKYLESNREYILDKISRKSESPKSDRRYFSQLWEAYSWIAILGFLKNKRVPLTDHAPGDNIKADAFKFGVIFNNGEDIAYALILAAVSKSKKGYEVLENPSEIIQIISEYANGGFQIITEKMAENPSIFQNPNDFIQELLDR